MGINYFNTKTFTDGLRKSHRSGGPAVRAAKKAQQILGAIVSNSANPFKGFKETNFGDFKFVPMLKNINN